jgi:hypothetical protein
MKRLTVSSNVDGILFYLPPRENWIQNGDFEQTGSWTAEGVVTPTPVQGTGHTGDYALWLGEPPQDVGVPLPWTWAVRQAVAVPDSAREITLDWMYRVEGTARPGDQLLVAVEGRSEIVQSLPLSGPDWTHEWLDLTSFAGQEVTVSFALRRQSDDEALTVWLDEVGLGTNILGHAFLPVVARFP